MTADLELCVRFELLRYGSHLDSEVVGQLSRTERSSLGGHRGPERAAAILAGKRAAASLSPAWEIDDIEVFRREKAVPVLLVAGRDVGLRLCVAHADGLAVAAVTWNRHDVGSGSASV